MTDADLVVVPPLSSIQAWSGLLVDVPDGWQLCDGTNGTPDLRGRFIVGIGAVNDNISAKGRSLSG